MTVKRYNPVINETRDDIYMVMELSDGGKYVVYEAYAALRNEKNALAAKTTALLDSMGTAKFTVKGADIVCMKSGVLGGSTTAGFVYGDVVAHPAPATQSDASDHTTDALRYATVAIDWAKGHPKKINRVSGEELMKIRGCDDEDPEPPTAPDILEAGAKHMRDRAKLYDQPGGERSMSHAVSVFEALTGITLTAQDGWLFMVVLKLVRAQKNPDHLDNYEDACAYVALLAEEQAGDV